MKKKNIIRVLSLLLCLAILASLSLIPAAAAEETPVEDGTATWIYDSNTGELTGYFPDTGEVLVYKEAEIPSRVFYWPLHYYEYETTLEIDGETYTITSMDRGDYAVCLAAEYSSEIRLMLTEEGMRQVTEQAAYLTEFYSVKLIHQTSYNIAYNTLSDGFLSKLAGLPTEGQITSNLFDLRNTPCYALMGRVDVSSPYTVTVGYIYELEGTLYYLDATVLSDTCFDGDGGLNPMQSVTVTLTPLTAELAQSTYDSIDNLTKYTPYTEYEGDTDDDTGVIIVGLIFLYMTAIPAGLTLPLFPFIAGLILPHLRATGKKKRWYTLSVISALWMILSVILLIVITVATILML